METEAYIGAIDKAAHCYNQRVTKTEVMFGHQDMLMFISFMECIVYECRNGAGRVGAAVIRAGTAGRNGIDEQKPLRKRYEELPQKRIQLSNGPENYVWHLVSQKQIMEMIC